MVGAFAVVLALLSIALSLWRDYRQPLKRRLAKLVEELSEQLSEVTLRVIELELELTEYRINTPRLIGQLLEAGVKPVWRPRTLLVHAEGDESLLIRLAQMIEVHFNVDEMNALAFDVGVLEDEFAGETKKARSRSLVAHCARHGKLEQLLDKCTRQRPGLAWPRVE